MAKVIVKRLAKPGKAKSTSVTEKRVRKGDGKIAVVRTLDGRSDSFGSDLTYVFSRNVARARRENKQISGEPTPDNAEG